MKKTIFLGIMIMFSIVSMALAASANTFDYNNLDLTLMNQDPDPAEPGDYVELRWKVVKEGNDKIDDLRFNLDVDYPFFFDEIDTPEKNVGMWQGWSDDEEYYILYYKIRVDEDAIEDVYTINLESSQDSTDYYQSQEFDIKVGDDTKPELVLGSLVTSPNKLLADTEENELKVTLENIGDENAENVMMELQLPDGFEETYGYSTRATLGTVAAGEGAVGTFYVNLDESVLEGEYNASVNVHYKEANDEDNEYKVLELPLEIPVNGKPMFDIESIKTYPEEIHEGDDVELLVSVKNVGTKEADSVSIRAFKESSQPFEFDEKSDFIGKLQPGESGDAILKFSVDSDANAKSYLLDVEIRGIYNDEVITENEVVNVDVNDGENSAANLVVGIITILVIVIAGFIGYRWFKKR